MRGKILTAILTICVLSSAVIRAQTAPDNTNPKKMQIGAPFTLIFELTPNAEPSKVDNIVSVGNRILLGHSKTSFDWYIASTTSKWIKLSAGKANTGDTVKIALSYDGSTLRSYHNGVITASSQVNRQQFTGVQPIVLNEWHGEYNIAYAFAKTLNTQAIKAFENTESKSTGSASVEKPTKSTVNTPTNNTKPSAALDPTQPTDIGPVNTSQPTGETPSESSSDNEVQPELPVTEDTSQPTDVQPVKPVTEDSSQPTEVEPVQPVTEDPSQPTEVEPVEPVQAPSETPTEKPTKPSANTPSAPTDLPSDTTVKRISITAKVLALTKVPEPGKILPYKHAIVTQEVQVVSIDKGALKGIKKGDKLRIARWGILQGQKTDVAKAKVGDVVKLPLEDYKDHPELERQYTVDTLPESFDLPYLLDVSE